MTRLSLYELQDKECRELDIRARILSAKIRNLERHARTRADVYSGEIEDIYSKISEMELEHHELVIKLMTARARVARRGA